MWGRWTELHVVTASFSQTGTSGRPGHARLQHVNALSSDFDRFFSAEGHAVGAAVKLVGSFKVQARDAARAGLRSYFASTGGSAHHQRVRARSSELAFGFMRRVLPLLKAHQALLRGCVDRGPFACTDLGCPSAEVNCSLLSKVCPVMFHDLWERPPPGLATQTIASQCCATCAAQHAVVVGLEMSWQSCSRGKQALAAMAIDGEPPAYKSFGRRGTGDNLAGMWGGSEPAESYLRAWLSNLQKHALPDEPSPQQAAAPHGSSGGSAESFKGRRQEPDGRELRELRTERIGVPVPRGGWSVRAGPPQERTQERSHAVTQRASLSTCTDGGPWPCLEAGCPRPMVTCADLTAHSRNVCNARFAHIWEHPPEGVQEIWKVCPRSCGQCTDPVRETASPFWTSCLATSLAIRDAHGGVKLPMTRACMHCRMHGIATRGGGEGDECLSRTGRAGRVGRLFAHWEVASPSDEPVGVRIGVLGAEPAAHVLLDARSRAPSVRAGRLVVPDGASTCELVLIPNDSTTAELVAARFARLHGALRERVLSTRCRALTRRYNLSFGQLRRDVRSFQDAAALEEHMVRAPRLPKASLHEPKRPSDAAAGGAAEPLELTRAPRVRSACVLRVCACRMPHLTRRAHPSAMYSLAG